MKNKIIILGGFLFSLIIIFLLGNNLFLGKKKELNKETIKKENSQGTEINQPSEIIKYSLEEIAKHNTKEDCWLVINEKVYNVTSFISLHPGGSAILLGCGKDASDLFTKRKTAEGEKIGSGKPHSPKAQDLLDKYYLGQLK